MKYLLTALFLASPTVWSAELAQKTPVPAHGTSTVTAEGPNGQLITLMVMGDAAQKIFDQLSPSLTPGDPGDPGELDIRQSKGPGVTCTHSPFLYVCTFFVDAASGRAL